MLRKDLDKIYKQTIKQSLRTCNTRTSRYATTTTSEDLIFHQNIRKCTYKRLLSMVREKEIF